MVSLSLLPMSAVTGVAYWQSQQALQARVMAEMAAAFRQMMGYLQEMAAQVEQVNAAAQALSDMAESLLHLMARFKLPADMKPGQGQPAAQASLELA